jgi:YVTN family beta-propeller protein
LQNETGIITDIMKEMTRRLVLLLWIPYATYPSFAQSYAPPAGLRAAARRTGPSIIPGGRVIASIGQELPTGPGAFGLVVSSSGRTAVTANGGPGGNSLTVLERDRTGVWQARQFEASPPEDPDDRDEEDDWKSVFMGLALAGDHSAYVSEGNDGRVSLFDWNSERRRSISLNGKGYQDSYAGDMALDTTRGILYVVDQANFRVAVIDTKSRQVVASVRVGRLPFALALAPDRQKLYVTNLGMFQYQPLPGVDRKRPKETGLPFPAFGFPSAEAVRGAERRTDAGTVQVPGLGDPNLPEANSVCVVDVSNPSAPKVETFIRTGLSFGEKSQGGSSPSGIAVTADRVFVSNAANDSISMIDRKTNRVEVEIPIRIPGLEDLRGVLPMGLEYHSKSGWLFVAEAGINAVAVLDTRQKRVIGHVPAGWFPTRVAVQQDTVFVTNARGHGMGPNGGSYALPARHLRQGTLSIFPVPTVEQLSVHTAFAMNASGFQPRPAEPRPLPAGIKYVVLIVKENRTYDEVMGDISHAANGPVVGDPELARFGANGFADGRGVRLSIKGANIAPNHRAIATRWAFSDNFYADSDVSVDGHHWLVGSYPNAWTESSRMASSSPQKKDFRLGAAPGRLLFAESNSSVHPEEQLEAGAIWHHFERHGVPFYNFGEGFELAGVVENKDLEPTGARFLTNVPMPDPLYRNTSREYPGFNMNVPDQYRATQFIREMEAKYVKPDIDLPRFLFVHLPNDHMTKARPEDGYPYQESFVADNDYALGRILEFLSGTKWWKEMAVLITEDDAQGGVDHIDGHRTVMMIAGPWARRNYVSHRNSSFPGLLKTIFRLLKLPPLNLFDAAAADLADCFTTDPDFTPYKTLPVDPRVFDPAAARQAPPGTPSPRMDDPREVRR